MMSLFTETFNPINYFHDSKIHNDHIVKYGYKDFLLRISVNMDMKHVIVPVKIVPLHRFVISDADTWLK